MVTCKSLEDAFHLPDLGSHAQGYFDKVWRDLIHKYKELGHKEEDLRAFFVDAVKTQITQIASERYKAGKSEGISISFIRGSFARKEPKKDWSRFWVWVAGAIAAVVIVGGIIFGISINKVANPTVAIEINLGEVLAGLLGGTGVAIAGIAYARKASDSKDERIENKRPEGNQ